METTRACLQCATTVTPLSVLQGYDPTGFYDEMFASLGQPRPHYQILRDHLQTMTAEILAERRRV